jgi:hypothetical protein
MIPPGRSCKDHGPPARLACWDEFEADPQCPSCGPYPDLVSAWLPGDHEGPVVLHCKACGLALVTL